MIFNFVLLSLLFAFVYWWYMMEERLERFAWLFWYGIIAGVNPALWGFSDDTVIMLGCLLMLMIVQWYIGFKTGWGVIREP
jgi:hypothetical protein